MLVIETHSLFKMQILKKNIKLSTHINMQLLQLGIDVEWQYLDELSNTVDAANILLLDDTDVDLEFAPLFNTLTIIVLVQEWRLQTLSEWLNKGATNCIHAGDIIAATASILSEYYRHQRNNFKPNNNPELLQAVFDSLPIPLFFKDKDHIYRGCNTAFENYLGFSRNELLGRDVYYVAPKELAQRYERADIDLLNGDGLQKYETQVRYADGTLRDVQFHKAVFLHPENQVYGQVGAIFDITERNLLEKQLRELTLVDELTGAPNRRAFFQTATREIEQSKRNNRLFSTLVLDVDKFKKINDSYGHAAGDLVLQNLVIVCRELIRAQDTFFRVGGEEFYFILPDTQINAAKDIASRLCQGLEHSTVLFADSAINYTVSIGVAEYAINEDITHLLHRADEALYEAKMQGRNQVVVAS
jgi:diguanylate cyclase (GGDEF)-like protein/PAS domain S-box-containing protein